MNSISRLTLVLLLLLGLAGCATLNQSECLNADWTMVGMEDGAKGHPVSRIGEHRRACAEYGITPDLEQYRAGHALGIDQFCTPSNGYRIGQRGGQYPAVCPPGLEEAFLDGYDAGRQLYTVSRELRQADSSIKAKKNQLAQLEEEIRAREQRLISDRTSEAARRRLLDKLREDENLAATLADEIWELELIKADRQQEYDALRRSSPY